MAEFRMPTLGADMEAGTLVAWKKKPGDRVSRGVIIAEVDTDKAIIDVEVFTSGTLEKIVVQPGEKVPVGTVLAIIREEGAPSARPVTAGAAETGQAAGPEETPSPATAQPSPPRTAPARLRISPVARRRAQELGVDPSTIHGSGPDAAVTLQDVEATALQARDTRRQAMGEAAADKQTRMRQAIAAAMARSKREIPHYYLSMTIDMTPALTWLRAENARRSVADRLLYGVLLIKAVALALREVPELNSVWKDGQAVRSEAIHVGVAISLRQGGLVAPALHDADQQTLDKLMRGLQDLVKRARAGSLRSSELADPTITVTNLGEQGVETVFGVIYPPQVALVGFGKVVERPWVVDGRVQPRSLVSVSLSADHRVSDGHQGGLFLATLDRLLQQPDDL